MTDLEMTKLCAQAMGFSSLVAIPITESTHMRHTPPQYSYNPLHDDAQAMALLKRFNLSCDRWPDHAGRGLPVPISWRIGHVRGDGFNVDYVMADDLNRAIVECVAKMQSQVRSPEKDQTWIGYPGTA